MVHFHLIFTCIFAIFTRTVNSERVLSSPLLTNWGTWGMWEYCPPGSFVTGMQLHVQSPQGLFKDDRSLTGIRLFCNHYGVKGDNFTIKSSLDTVGYWGTKYYCRGMMTGFQLRSEPYRSFLVDDTAANNLRMFCDGDKVSFKQGDGNSFGSWTSKQLCEPNEAICGISTQVDWSNSMDKTGVNNVKMKCCNIPHPLKNCAPATSWQLVASCYSVSSASAKTCKYSRKVGISFTSSKGDVSRLYEGIGLGLKKTALPFRTKFMNTSTNMMGLFFAGHEDSTKYYWYFAPDVVWDPETKHYAQIVAKKGYHRYHISVYQIHGTCGQLQVWGTKMKKVVSSRINGGDKETSTTSYFDFRDENDMDYLDQQ